MVEQADLGLIGLAVMGENLALNVESRGYTVAVYNRTVEKVDELLAGRGRGKRLAGAHSLAQLVEMLKRPRKILLMVKAGPAVDDLIDQLLPLLAPGDILIDGGNTHYADTQRRCRRVTNAGFLYVGTGISGGEEGALKGPSIMPGGSPEAWPAIGPIFQSIAAKVGPNRDLPCCEWIGPDGAGHYVKMVHNGIEYGDMQLICEAYLLLREALGLEASELAEVFSEWNAGELDSYLIEITRDIFTVVDSTTGKPLVDQILDTAGQKGTGKWMSQLALDLGVPTTLITEAVFARCLSAQKQERVAASKVLLGPDRQAAAKLPLQVEGKAERAAFQEAVRQALYASKIVSYAQGFVQLAAAAKEEKWDLRFGEIAMLWRGGCIIRARFLERIKDAFDRDRSLANLLLDPYFRDAIAQAQGPWRMVVATAVMLGLPVPAFSSALAYYDGYRAARLPANLLQAQRDYFGAHTYSRIDQPGTFHTHWLRERRGH